MKTFFYTTIALFAFAGNSVLCRLALGEHAIDAANFTIIRLFSGIFVLAIIIKTVGVKKTSVARGSWKASLMLFIYAVTFSFAYISMETGVGALVLFGSIQITIILASLLEGNKLHRSEWLGLFISFFGLVYLMMPKLGAPSFLGFFLMIISGCAWGFYTLLGRQSQDPLCDTAYNFFRTLPLVLILLVMTYSYSNLSQEGIILAILSGGLASGLGYTIWYMALKGLRTTQAAVVQLLVPVIAAIGGVVFAHETISLRLLFSSLAILGGILVVVLAKDSSSQILD